MAARPDISWDGPQEGLPFGGSLEGGPLEVPSLREAMVWGPLGVAFVYALALFLNYYRQVVIPRAKSWTESQIAESQARSDSQKRIGDAVETVADCIVRYDMRFDATDKAIDTLRTDMNRGFDRLYRRRSDGSIDVDRGDSQGG